MLRFATIAFVLEKVKPENTILERLFSRAMETLMPRATGNVLWISVILISSVALQGAPAAASPKALTMENSAVRVEVDPATGSYAIFGKDAARPVLRAREAAEVDGRWLHSDDYPAHDVKASDYRDELGSGRQISIRNSGLKNSLDLICILKVYDDLPFGTVEVRLVNSSGHAVSVQAIRTAESSGNPPFDLGGPLASTRVLSDSFSEDRPVLHIRDLNDAPDGMHRAVGSQLIYNRESGRSLLLATLSSRRFITLLHLKGHTSAGAFQPDSYTVTSTGTTEILRGESLSESDAKDKIDLSLPLASGEAMDSERLMFATGGDYHQELETYGETIRKLFGPRPTPQPLIGWWSWTAYYFGINEGVALTNAAWMSAQLKNSGYVYVHLDEGYDYARGEYMTPDASHFPHGIQAFSQQLGQLGLKLGLWTAPFEVSERSWVYQNHKDWLVQNAEHQPIHIGHVHGKLDQLYVLDTTNPPAQQYLLQTYRKLSNEWAVRYIKMDFMDDTAIEGYYHRPNTTALEAQRIGLKIIRQAVGDNVVLDKDGSPMLNTVGLVDTGRLSADTGHAFEVIKDAASGIAARYYMNRNFFAADPDAYSVSKELVIDPDWHQRVRPMTLNEAQIAITLAAVAGGMFELGDDLPALGADQDRVALVRNRDLLNMIRLGHSAVPLDLLSYAPADGQPSVFLLHEDARQSVLAVFNWTEQATTHRFSPHEVGLPVEGQYKLVNVFDGQQATVRQAGAIEIKDQPPHSVRLLKIINTSVPPSAPAVAAHLPASATVASAVSFAAETTGEVCPALTYEWQFDDGISAEGASVSHAFTTAGQHTVKLRVEGLDGIPFEGTYQLAINGEVDTHFNPKQNRRYTAGETEPR